MLTIIRILLFAALTLCSLTAIADEASAEDPATIVRQEAKRAGIPAALALAVAEVESAFTPSAVSPAGAVGLMQIMPATAEGEFGIARDDLFDARINARVGTRFLARLLIRYEGNWDLALSHYNGGTIREGGDGKAHGYTRDYIIRIFRVMMRHLETERPVPDTAVAMMPLREPAPVPTNVAPADLDDFMNGHIRIGG